MNTQRLPLVENWEDIPQRSSGLGPGPQVVVWSEGWHSWCTAYYCCPCHGVLTTPIVSQSDARSVK